MRSMVRGPDRKADPGGHVYSALAIKTAALLPDHFEGQFEGQNAAKEGLPQPV